MKKIMSSILLISFMLLISCGGGSSPDSTVTNVQNNVLSSDKSVQTDIGNIDGFSIINIPYDTTLSDFKIGLTISDSADFEIYKIDGITVATTLKTSYRLKVVAEDNSVDIYTLSVLADERILTGYENFDLDSDDYDVVGAVIDDGMTEETNSLSFSGDPIDLNYMIIPYDEKYDLRDTGTLEVWVKARTIIPWSGIVSKGESNTFEDEAYGLQLATNEGSEARLLFFVYNDAGSWIGAKGTFDLEVDTWYYVVGTWDADNLYLYVNGELDATIPNTTGGVKQTTGGITVGAQLIEQYNPTYGNLGWDGWINSVNIFNVYMDADEVLTRYNDQKQ